MIKSLNKKAGILVILSVLLVMFSFSVVYADGTITDQASFEKALKGDGKYTLENDISIAKGATVFISNSNKMNTIDLKGHKIDLQGSITLMGTATKKEPGQYHLTIDDTVGTGEINFSMMKTSSGLFNVDLEFYTFELIVNKGTFNQMIDSASSSSFFVFDEDELSSCSLKIKGGTFVNFSEVVKFDRRLKPSVTRCVIQTTKSGSKSYLTNIASDKIVNWVDKGSKAFNGNIEFKFSDNTNLNQLFAEPGKDLKILPSNEVPKIKEGKFDIDLPPVGKTFRKLVKLEEGFPGTIESYRWFERIGNEEDYTDENVIGSVAEYGSTYTLEIKVRLNVGEIWDNSPQCVINGEKYKTFKANRSTDTVCIFTITYKPDYSSKITITAQTPEKVEFTRGETITLFVVAEGASNYQWEKLNGIKEISYSKIANANTDELVLKDLDASYNKQRYTCELTCEDGIRRAKTMELILVDVKTQETPTKPVVEVKEEPKEEPVQKIELSSVSGWAVEEINKANDAGLIPMIFNRQDLTRNITRKGFAHVAVKLYEKLSGTKVEVNISNPFTDVNDDEVLKAYIIGITQGTSETTFEPDLLITREQMATMMTRALSKAGINTKVDMKSVEKFADDSEIGEWYVESVYFMSGAEIIKGIGDNQFGPKGNATIEASLLLSIRSAEKYAK